MSPAFHLLIGYWLGSAFAPGALDCQLASADARRLPLGFARDQARQVALVFHADPDQPVAAYLPSEHGSPERLALFSSQYVRGVELRPLSELTADLSEPFLYALLERHLGRQVHSPGSALGAELRRRAEATMVDVPPAHRTEAYLDALASFGSHLLSVVNELDRSEQRRRSSGRSSLCTMLAGRSAPLINSWEQILGDGGYAGTYGELGPHGEERVRTSRVVIAIADKQLLVERVLGQSWRGTVLTDLAPRLCAGYRR